MPRRKTHKKRPDIVSALLSPAAKSQLDHVCEQRGMSIKMFLGRLILWFLELNRSEQSIVLGHLEQEDATSLAELIASRKGRGGKRV